MADDVADRLFGKFDLLRRDSVFLDLPRNQILEGDVNFLFLGVTLKLNNLHAVAQGLGDRIEHIRGGNEQHLGEIESHVQIVVAKRCVLFRIERFEQRRRRIATKVASHLVNFVEHKDRIFRLSAPYSLNDLPGQSSDVGAAMATNFRFVVHSAERQTRELASERARNGFTQRSFAHARRPDETQDRAFHVGLQTPHGKVIEDAVFHFLQVIVVGVENLFCLRDFNFAT